LLPIFANAPSKAPILFVFATEAIAFSDAIEASTNAPAADNFDTLPNKVKAFAHPAPEI